MTDRQFNGKQLQGLPGSDVPVLGQQKVEPMAVIVDGPNGKKILLQCVAMHVMSDEALAMIADAVAERIKPMLDELFRPAATG